MKAESGNLKAESGNFSQAHARLVLSANNQKCPSKRLHFTFFRRETLRSSPFLMAASHFISMTVNLASSNAGVIRELPVPLIDDDLKAIENMGRKLSMISFKDWLLLDEPEWLKSHPAATDL